MENKRIPKSLIALAASIGARVEVLSFRMHGRFQTGFAVVDSDNNELLVLEPVSYSNGDRWLVKNNCIERPITYVKDLRGFTADIKPMHTGFKFGMPDLRFTSLTRS